MDSAARPRFDPSFVGSVILVCLVLTACAASTAVTRTARMIVESVWLYVSSTRG